MIGHLTVYFAAAKSRLFSVSAFRWSTSIFVVFLAMSAACHASLAQPADSQYSLSVVDVPTVDALKAFSDETGAGLVYNPALLENKRTHCRAKGDSIEELLECVLDGTGLTFRRLPSGAFTIIEEAVPRPDSQALKKTLSGYVRDAASGETLVGAAVYAPAFKQGTATNRFGFFSLTLPADSAHLVFSSLGYTPLAVEVDFGRADPASFELDRTILSMEELVVEAGQTEPAARETRMSYLRIPVEQLESAPALLGEVDILKSLQLLPGVQSGVEGSSGLYVRGGGPDQNLILLDGTPVYNVNHLFGFLSVFNSDAVQDVEITKGGFPARYGGRMSSIIEVNMKDGNLREHHVEGSIGLLNSRLTVEGPLVKDRTSFMISGRRSYADLILRPIIATQEVRPSIYFYDLNAKINHIFSPKDRVYVSAYAGRDHFGVTTENDAWRMGGALGWSNLTAAVRWNHLFSNKLFSNTTLTYSQYEFGVRAESDRKVSDDTYRLRYDTGIEDWSARIDFDYLPAPDHYVRFGASSVRHTFQTGTVAFRVAEGGSAKHDTTATEQTIPADEWTAYVEDDVRLSDRLKVNLGVHASAFGVRGRRYLSFQPRASARYLLHDRFSIKASYARMTQYIHLLSHSGVGLPTDLWVPATDRLPPQDGWQAALGMSHTNNDGTYETSIEGYYKSVDGPIEYRSGASYLQSGGSFEEKVTSGRGWSYGAEVLVRKKTGRTTGWLGYTLAWSMRRFDDLNNGEVFPFRYDRRHDVSLLVTHRLNPRFDLSATWVYGTGHAVTLPLAEYFSSNMPAYERLTPGLGGWSARSTDYVESRNGYRLPAYHRLDIGADWYISRRHDRRHVLSFGLYNTYYRKNPYALYVAERSEDRGIIRGVSFLPILPFVNYKFSF